MDRPFAHVLDASGRAHILNINHIVCLSREGACWKVVLTTGVVLDVDDNGVGELLLRLPGALQGEAKMVEPH